MHALEVAYNKVVPEDSAICNTPFIEKEDSPSSTVPTVVSRVQGFSVPQSANTSSAGAISILIFVSDNADAEKEGSCLCQCPKSMYPKTHCRTDGANDRFDCENRFTFVHRKHLSLSITAFGRVVKWTNPLWSTCLLTCTASYRSIPHGGNSLLALFCGPFACIGAVY